MSPLTKQATLGSVQSMRCFVGRAAAPTLLDQSINLQGVPIAGFHLSSRLACTASPKWLTRYLTFPMSAPIVKHVPNHCGFDEVGRVFHALADPTRRAIVERLVERPAAVKALAEPLAMSLPAVMQHLRVLEEAGVIVTEKVGRVRTCRIEPTALRDAERWLSGQRTEWERQLDQLDDYLKGQ